MKTSGVRIVDEMMKFNATGNVIPAQWYKTITKENGKPNLNAIILLSDIVYWYKPTIVRNEATGEVEGLKKRFKGDMLQRTYQSFSEQFGISKRDAMNAIVALEKLGVVKRHFRSIKVETLLVNNVLFIELVPEVLFKLTFDVVDKISTCESSSSQHSEGDPPPKKETPTPQKKVDLPLKKVIAPTQKSDTNTEITTETTIKGYIHNPIYAQTDACAGEGTKKQTAPSEKKTPAQRKQELADMFDEFWKVYPKKKNKVAAKQAFFKLMPDRETFVAILKAVHVAIRSYDWRKDNGQYIPYPSSWLNGRRWEDEQSVGVEPVPAVQANTAINTHAGSRPVYGNNIAMQSLQRAAESPNADVDYSVMSPEEYMALEDAVWNEKK